MKKYVLILLASLAISCSPAPQQKEIRDDILLRYYYEICWNFSYDPSGAKIGLDPLSRWDPSLFPKEEKDADVKTRCIHFALKMLEVSETSKGCRKND